MAALQNDVLNLRTFLNNVTLRTERSAKMIINAEWRVRCVKSRRALEAFGFRYLYETALPSVFDSDRDTWPVGHDFGNHVEMLILAEYANETARKFVQNTNVSGLRAHIVQRLLATPAPEVALALTSGLTRLEGMRPTLDSWRSDAGFIPPLPPPANSLRSPLDRRRNSEPVDMGLLGLGIL